jgi:hypothetical protein
MLNSNGLRLALVFELINVSFLIHVDSFNGIDQVDSLPIECSGLLGVSLPNWKPSFPQPISFLPNEENALAKRNRCFHDVASLRVIIFAPLSRSRRLNHSFDSH